jgi:hypothetical protein
MRNLIRALVSIPVLALSACGGGGTDDSSALANSAGVGREVVLDYGDIVDLGKLSLEFTAVEDSRCSVGSAAVCVWEGNAQVFITATEGQASQILTLNTSLKFPPSAMFAGHVIELRQLDPQPTHTDIGRPNLEDYSATLFVDGVP